jgi:dihydroorotase-like cyclic amidohydrolase
MRWLVGGEVLDVDEGTFRRVDVGIDTSTGRIAELGTARPTADDEVVDVSGQWLLPGLIDCHVHLTLPTTR